MTEIGVWRSKVEHPKSENGDLKWEIGHRKSEIGDRTSEVGDRTSEVRVRIRKRSRPPYG